MAASVPLISSSTSSEEELCAFGIQALFISVLPTAIKTAIELDVFDIIVSGGPQHYLSAVEISAQLPRMHPNTPHMLGRTLDVLATYNFLTCKVGTAGERKYGAAPVTKLFVKRDDGWSLAPLALLVNGTTYRQARENLTDATMDGVIPFEKAFGTSVYQFAGNDPMFNKAFNEAMVGRTVVIMTGILDTYKGFDNINSLVDVGGGLGSTIEFIVKKHPHIKGINFDLPHVISNAPQIPGIEHVAGDMFEHVPHGDAILIKAILHNWDDEKCVKLLKNCWKALGENGKVVAIDKCLPAQPELDREAQVSFQLDFHMMLLNTGKERTVEQFHRLGKEAGFCKVENVCNYATHYVIEFYK